VVHDLLRTLRLGPYKDLGKITFQDVLRTYGVVISLISLVFVLLVLFTGLILKLNRRIKASHLYLTLEIEQVKKLDEELKQAKDMAIAATRAKSEFLANMSHEIRTPMNGIIAATDLALSEKLTPTVEEYLHIVQNSSYALLGIINDILDFSKIEAGQMELKERQFRLDEIFDRVMDVFIHQAGEKGIELLVDIDKDAPRLLLGDSLRLQQIITNLISNSIKFTPAGGSILISAQQRAIAGLDEKSDQVELVFSVKDTGAGIEPDYLPLLFEPFTQGDSSSTRKAEGTGLGLSICKKFVTMMQGDIWVESTLGKGSTFYFSVRFRKAAGDASACRVIFPPDIRGLNALVVDDLIDSRIIIGKILASLGFKVESLASGIEALERLQPERMKKDSVDLIMLDWKMPDLDGIETSKKIREELHLTVPIIMMTAFGKDVQRSEAEAAGANGFLPKPIFQSTLFDAIMDAFGKHGSKRTDSAKDFTTRSSMYQRHLKGYRLLLAEDNLTNQQVAKAILEKAGIQVAVVNNGEEAVQAVRETLFDGVLMDIQMPRMNGYEATRRIRMLPDCGRLPIIAMTAHAMKGDEEKCLEAGMDGYIAKPINQDRLFHTLWRFLRNRRPGGLTDQKPDSGEMEPAAENLFPQMSAPVQRNQGRSRGNGPGGQAAENRCPGDAGIFRD
jgi:two-component system, sensor histidine kinase and response regulator